MNNNEVKIIKKFLDKAENETIIDEFLKEDLLDFAKYLNKNNINNKLNKELECTGDYNEENFKECAEAYKNILK